MAVRIRPSAPVLIVEDNDETRNVLEVILQSQGYATATARDGREALAYVVGGNPVSLIILDLKMPVMDGWTFMQHVRANSMFAHLPVIAFSANIDTDLPGAVATVRKAFVDPDLFLGIIERACLKDQVSH